MSIHLKAAYGRNYKNFSEAYKDFIEGKDFQLVDTGQYCSIRDFNPIDYHLRGVFLLYFVDGRYQQEVVPPGAVSQEFVKHRIEVKQ
jgi:hypothetical protein